LLGAAQDEVVIEEEAPTRAPRTAAQAWQTPRWRDASLREIETLEEKGTFTYIEYDEIQEGHTPLMCQFKYTVKHDEDDNVIKYKARLMAHGMCQEYQTQNKETFAATSQGTPVITCFTYAVQSGQTLMQADVQAAFVNATLQETIYVSLPPQLRHGRRYARLNKSLYSLKQAAARWSKVSHELLMAISGMTQNKSEPCWYSLVTEKGLVVHILLYADDYLIATNSPVWRRWFIAHFNKSFVLKDLGPVKHYMGIGVKHANGTMELSREAAILATIDKYGMGDANDSPLPMTPGEGDKLTVPETDADNHPKFRALLGELMYHCRTCRPDIRLALCILSRFCAKNTPKHYKELTRVLCYLKRTIKMTMIIRKQPGGALGSIKLCMFVDATWGSCPDTLRSVSGWVILLNGNTVSCNSKRQSTIAGSSAAAEVIALSDALHDLQFLWQTLKQITTVELPMAVYEDNNSARAAFTNTSAGRLRYLDIRFFTGRELVDEGIIVVHRVDSNQNIADYFTKPLGEPTASNYVRAFMGHKQVSIPSVLGGVLRTASSAKEQSG
jgi:hypothetical protein